MNITTTALLCVALAGTFGYVARANQEKPKAGNLMKIIGHRGAPTYATENTIASFQKAIDLGVWAIELDVRRCKSGQLILMHDADIDRVSGVHGLVNDMELNELQAITLKTGGTIPTLAEALDSIGARVNVILDIKEEGLAADIATLVHTYVKTKGWKYDQFFATGFEHRELKKIHDLIPAIRLIPATAGTPYTLAQFGLELNAYAICLIDFVFSKPLFDDARKRGLNVWVWVSNEHADNIKKFKSLGVDAIMVNAPDNVYKES